MEGGARRRRLLFVDDDRRFCALATSLLENDFDVRVVHHVRGALAAATDLPPAVAVVDLGLPDGDGVEVVAALSNLAVPVPVLVLTSAVGDTRIMAALRAGARGYLFKEDFARLPLALDDVMRGGLPMSASVTTLVLQLLLGTSTAVPAPAPYSTLTARECDVMEGLRRGMSYAEVGALLGMSTNTVRTHIRSVYEKLDVSSKTEAVLEALRLGLLR
jgi:DNA-binding NarL/FixJ family response regulator